MLIAVSANSSDMGGQIEPRFGRAAGFIIYDVDSAQSRFVENVENSQLAQGAGLQTAQMLAEQGVSVIISGTFGPKATEALGMGGIGMVSVSNGMISEVIDNFINENTEPTADLRKSPAELNRNGGGCRRMGGTGMGRGMANGGRGMGGGGGGMGGRGIGGRGRGQF